MWFLKEYELSVASPYIIHIITFIICCIILTCYNILKYSKM